VGTAIFGSFPQSAFSRAGLYRGEFAMSADRSVWLACSNSSSGKSNANDKYVAASENIREDAVNSRKLRSLISPTARSSRVSFSKLLSSSSLRA